MHELRERALRAELALTQEQRRAAADAAFNPMPSIDDPVAMARYKTALEDKKLGWMCHAEIESYGAPKMLLDWIAFTRRQIKSDIGATPYFLAQPWWLKTLHEHVEHHESLMKWIVEHKDETILCFSDHCNYVESDDDRFPYYGSARKDAEDWLKRECKGRVSYFDNRYKDHFVFAFETKAEAERFRSHMLAYFGERR